MPNGWKLFSLHMCHCGTQLWRLSLWLLLPYKRDFSERIKQSCQNTCVYAWHWNYNFYRRLDPCFSKMTGKLDVWIVVKSLHIPPWDRNAIRARPARAAVGLITSRCESRDWMVTVTLERQGYPRSLGLIAAAWNLAQRVKRRISKPEIPGYNPRWVDLALPFLSGMLAGLVFKAPSLSQITCLFEYYLQKHILYAGCFDPPTNLLGS